MSEKLVFWNQVSRPPKWALRQIQGGRLNGKTDISPQWRLQAMTELFGPCGSGWKYDVDRLWTESGSEGQVCAMALVNVSYRIGDSWSAPIPGIGGNMLIDKEKNGLHTNDEAFKMAVTDALSVAMKALGMGAEIYSGNFDGSKYIRETLPVAEKTLDVNAFKDAVALAESIVELQSLYLKHKEQIQQSSCKTELDKFVSARKAELSTPTEE